MTLISLTRGMVIKSTTRGCVYRCRSFSQNSLYRPTSVALRAIARTEAGSEAPVVDPITTRLPNDDSKPWKTLFDLQLPEGQCLGLQLHSCQYTKQAMNDWIVSNYIHQDEVNHAMQQPSEYTRQTFLLGRIAMRQVLGPSDVAILKDDHGRPRVPPGFLGSISHKRCREQEATTGVALLAPRLQQNMGVGVDIELATSERSSIAKRVLTQDEIDDLGRIEGVSKDEEVLLRFSLKEAFYKAIHPLICQYVGFQEAQVTPHADGTATVDWNLKSGAHKQFQDVSGHWRRIDDFFLSSASVSLCEEDGGEECVDDEPLQQ